MLHVLTPLNCPPLHVLPRELTYDLPLERRPPLSDLTVQHVGQHMAVVVADTLENAIFAASLFELDYESPPAQLTASEVLGHRSHPTRRTARSGTAATSRITSSNSTRRSCRTAGAPTTNRPGDKGRPPLHHADQRALSDRTVVDDRALGRRRPHRARQHPVDHRRAHRTGGLPRNARGRTFGSCLRWWVAPSAPRAFCGCMWRCARSRPARSRRPVKLVLTRDQMFSSTGHRPRTEQDLALVADARGRDRQHRAAHPDRDVHRRALLRAGRAVHPLPVSSRRDLVVSHTMARINAPTPCFMRGPGEAPGLFALEVAMDELAYATGVDPVELRLRNHAGRRPGQRQSRGRASICWSAIEQGARAVRLAASGRWRRAHCAATASRSAGAWRPRPIPAAGCPRAAGWHRADGRVRFASATHEVGNGVRTVMTQMAAEADRACRWRRSASTPATRRFPTRRTAAPRRRPRRSARRSTRPPRRMAARFLDLSVDDPNRPSSAWIPPTRHRRQRRGCRRHPMSVVDCLQSMRLDALNFVVTSDGAERKVRCRSRSARTSARSRWTRRSAAPPWCGGWRSWTAAGCSIPKLARNQVMGGITFGLGMALLEQVPYDPHTAQLIGEYYLPTHADRPDFDITLRRRTRLRARPDRSARHRRDRNLRRARSHRQCDLPRHRKAAARLADHPGRPDDAVSTPPKNRRIR